MDNECASPDITVVYEERIYSSSSRPNWIDVFDENMNLMERCEQDLDCGVWTTCVNGYKLGNGPVQPGDTITVNLQASGYYYSSCWPYSYI